MFAYLRNYYIARRISAPVRHHEQIIAMASFRASLVR